MSTQLRSLSVTLACGLALALMACGPGAGGPVAVKKADKKPVASAAPSSARTAFGRVLDLDGQPAGGVLVRGYLISDMGGELISDLGSSLVGEHGGGIISNNGGTLVAKSFGLLADATTSPATPLETHTAPDGSFELPAAGQPLNIEAVRSDDVKAIKLEVPADGTSLELHLAYTGAIHGRVTTPGAPQVTHHGGVDVYVPGTGYLAKTDDDGSYTIDHVPVGTFRLVASKTGLGEARIDGVVVASHATAAAPDLPLAITAPTLTSVTPANGGPGTEVTLVGDHFGASDGTSVTVQFGGALATSPHRVDDHTIKATVPAGAASGDVVVTVQDVASNARPFTVIQKLSLPSTLHDLRIGASQAYPVVATDAAGQAVEAPAVVWQASGAAIAVDEHGTVTAKGVGDATLTATSGQLHDQFAIHVADGPLVTTLAGSAPQGAAPALKDGLGQAASFARLTAMALAPDGAVIVGDYAALRRIDAQGQVSTLAGGLQPGTTLGKGKDAQLGLISGVAVAPDGSIYTTDSATLLRKVSPDGTVSAFAGQAFIPTAQPPGVIQLGPFVDGQADRAAFGDPTAVTIGPDGTLYVGDFNRIRAVTPGGVVTTLAGGSPLPTPKPGALPGPTAGADGVGTSASFAQITGLAVVGQALYVADYQRIRRVDLADPTHPVTTLPAPIQASVGFGLSADAAGTFYLTCFAENQIYSLKPTDAAPTPLAGGAGSADGPIATARFNGPLTSVPDGHGHLYVTEQLADRVRRIDLGP